MTPRAVLVAVAATAGASGARSEEQPAWQPGNETTATVSPEVSGDTRAARGDGAYGRFDGEVDLGVHGGVQLDDAASGLVGVTAHYYSMAGAYGRFADAFGNDDARRRRSLSFGIDLRPVFVPRWALDAQTGHALFDLVVDSIALELGGYVADPQTGFGDDRGFEASVGMGLPLLGTAPGPWLDARGLLRWGDPDGEARSAVLLSLGWHWMVATR